MLNIQPSFPRPYDIERKINILSSSGTGVNLISFPVQESREYDETMEGQPRTLVGQCVEAFQLIVATWLHMLHVERAQSLFSLAVI